MAKENLKSFEEISASISDNFNWDRVHKTMVALDWAWLHDKDKSGNLVKYEVPDVEALKSAALGLLKQLYEDKNETITTISTGGFIASWDDDELCLSFVVMQTSTRAVNTDKPVFNGVQMENLITG